mgnify:FL=1
MTQAELQEYVQLKKEIAEERARLKDIRGSKGKGIAATIERKIAKANKRQAEIEKYICGIDDTFVRRIAVARFIEGRSWWGVARKIGGNNTAESVRKIWFRWINKK